MVVVELVLGTCVIVSASGCSSYMHARRGPSATHCREDEPARKVRKTFGLFDVITCCIIAERSGYTETGWLDGTSMMSQPSEQHRFDPSCIRRIYLTVEESINVFSSKSIICASLDSPLTAFRLES